MKKYQLLTTKNIFRISGIVCFLTVLLVWLVGMKSHQSLFHNSLITTSILSFAFLLFIFTGLYKGVKLKDNLGSITNQYDREKVKDLKDSINVVEDFSFVSDGIGGIIANFLLSLLASFLLGFLIAFFFAFFWITILLFAAMLYWIFFRALRLVFKKSSYCKGNYLKSLQYALGYTVLYNFWIYVIILTIPYFSK
jgi:hypothetical protein